VAAWLAVEYGLPSRLQRTFGVLRWLAPLLASVGMILLDYHWVTDMVAGLALGVLLLRAVYAIDARVLGHWLGADGGVGGGRRADLAAGASRGSWSAGSGSGAGLDADPG
jgi:hypothetical protein